MLFFVIYYNMVDSKIKNKSKAIKALLNNKKKVRLFVDSDIDGVISAIIFKNYCKENKISIDVNFSNKDKAYYDLLNPKLIKFIMFTIMFQGVSGWLEPLKSK